MRLSESNTAARSHLFVLITLALIVMHSGYMRFHGLSNQSLWMDEAVSVIHAKAIMAHGYPILENGAVSLESLPWHYIQASLMMLIPDLHEGSRMGAVVAGIMLILMTFVLSMMVSGSKGAAVLASFLTAFLSYEIAWSRQARGYALLMLLTICAITAGLWFIRSKRPIALLACIILNTLAVMTHRGGYIAPLACLLLLIMNIPIQAAKDLAEKHGRQLAIIASVFMIGFAVMMILPTTAGLRETIRGIATPSEMNYSWMYITFLWDELGFLLPMAVIGMLWTCFLRPRIAIPMTMAVLFYFMTISYRTILFAHRYSLPLWPFLLLFAASVWWSPFQISLTGKGIRRFITLVTGLGLSGGILLAGNFAFAPKAHFMIDYTSPQPRWDDAFAMIANRSQHITKASGVIHIVTAFPILQDVYMADMETAKYYLPISHTGYPGEVQLEAPYTLAETINDIDRLLSLNGYVVLDDLGLRMLHNVQIKNYLMNKRPNAIIPGNFPAYIWLLTPTPPRQALGVSPTTL